jgi:predicted ribosome quality control (RQC) complex YloA/Tae2 family protein
MYKNYFFLLRASIRLSELICGKRIFEAFTQEKDRLFLRIPFEQNPDFHVIISVNPQQQFISYKEVHHKAKKNTISFFNDWIPDSITHIKIAINDRVIKFELNNSRMFIFFRGAQSNVVLIDSNNELHAFKKIENDEKEKLIAEIKSIEFTGSISAVTKFVKDFSKAEDLKKLPFISKEILREAEARNSNLSDSLPDVINSILYDKIAVFFNEDLNKPALYPASFRSIRLPEEHFLFDDYFSALNKYFSITYSRVKGKDLKKEIEKYLSSELEKLSTKLNKLKIRIESGSKELIYHKYGDLLLAGINSLKKGLKEAVLEDYMTNEKYKIQLDEKFSPSQNVQRYYEKARSEKIEFEKSKKLFEIASSEFNKLTSIRNKFEKTESNDDLLLIKKELKMKTQQNTDSDKQEGSSFRHFLIDNKYNVYVGKDSKNNDMLTVRFAKQNDFWFHARAVSGSHVVLRVENTKEPIPKNILKKAASLAAFYSKAKTSSLVPVTYTLRKYVVKNKSHDPGQVTVTKENVLLVKPEIPANCEAVTD